MQFVLVNERMPRGFSACVCCGQQLADGYLRARPSNQVYCSYQCYSGDREAGDWSFDRSGHLVQSMAVNGRVVDWATP